METYREAGSFNPA